MSDPKMDLARAMVDAHFLAGTNKVRAIELMLEAFPAADEYILEALWYGVHASHENENL